MLRPGQVYVRKSGKVGHLDKIIIYFVDENEICHYGYEDSGYDNHSPLTFNSSSLEYQLKENYDLLKEEKEEQKEIFYSKRNRLATIE